MGERFQDGVSRGNLEASHELNNKVVIHPENVSGHIYIYIYYTREDPCRNSTRKTISSNVSLKQSRLYNQRMNTSMGNRGVNRTSSLTLGK